MFPPASATAGTGRGTCSDISTSVPFMALNQCAVFSGTTMKSPFATLSRGCRPRCAVPVRLSPFRFSSDEFAARHHRRRAVDHIEEFRFLFVNSRRSDRRAVLETGVVRRQPENVFRDR